MTSVERESGRQADEATKEPAILVYDGDCGFCGASVRWVERASREGEFEFIPCQSPEREERVPHVRLETCLDAMVLVLPDGRTFVGSDATPHILRRTRRWRWLSYLFSIPGAWIFHRPVYRLIARNRSRLSCAIRRPE
jgi:predicted DCC family thiol-disulfide oxidoreductase YuxK